MTPANSAIRAELIKRLGNITRQGLDYRVKSLKGKLPMSSEDAIYVLAHQNKVDIGRHLDNETLTRVAGHVSRLESQTNGAHNQSQVRLPSSTRREQRVVRVAIAGINVDALPGLSEKHAKEAKAMAEKVFPALYVFENSARDLIEMVLDASVGKRWWDNDKIVSGGIKKNVTTRLAAEKKEPWHSSRGAHPIQYVDMTELAQIICAPESWPHFQKLFPRQSWVTGVFDDMNVSRRVVAHMNPLPDADIKQVEAGFQKWVRQLRAVESEFPST